MKIAIVDDDVVMRDTLESVIELVDPTVEIIKYTDGRDFLAEHQICSMGNGSHGMYPVDGVILDVLMPDITGLQVAKMLRNSVMEFKPVPTLFVTGMSDSTSVNMLESYGMILLKPYSLRTAAFILENWLNAVRNKDPKVQ